MAIQGLEEGVRVQQFAQVRAGIEAFPQLCAELFAHPWQIRQALQQLPLFGTQV
ncbi:hypothetical protein D9M71_388550 [compost metagenome]